MTEDKSRKWIRRGVFALVVVTILAIVGTPAVMTVVYALDEYTAPGEAPGRAMDFVVAVVNTPEVLTVVLVFIVLFAWGVMHLMAEAPNRVRYWRYDRHDRRMLLR